MIGPGGEEAQMRGKLFCVMDYCLNSADLADVVEIWLPGLASRGGPVLSLRGVKRRSNLILCGTGILPVIPTDR
jgi:hypothetical protein